MTTLTAKEAIGKAIGRIASGIYIVTTGSGDQKQGMLASWVMQAGFEPPSVTIAVQQDRDILKALDTNRRLVINVLSEGNTNIMGRFAKPKPDQFDGLDMYENDYGVVLKDTVAFLSCEIREKWTNGGDHMIFLSEIQEGEVMNGDLQPWTHLRKNGFVY